MMSDQLAGEWTEEKLIARAEAIGAHWAQRDEVDWYVLSRDILRLLRQQKDAYRAQIATLQQERDAAQVELQPDREALAEYAHEAWSGWMKYMFGKGKLAYGHQEGGGLADAETVYIMPAWAVERWQRQAATLYTDLPESEKASDRNQADKILAILQRRTRGNEVQP